MIQADKIIKALQVTNAGRFIGDDAAILLLHVKKYIISKDLLVEDVHSRISYFTPADLAHKSLHVN